MKNLLIRTITGIIFTGSIVGALLLGPYAFAGLMMVFTLAASVEIFRMFRKETISPQIITGMVFCGASYLIPTLICLGDLDTSWISLLVPWVLITFTIELFRKKPAPHLNIALTLLPAFYVAMPMALLNLLAKPDFIAGQYLYAVPLSFFIIIWTGDTMAYLGGMWLGRHKLFERISPKKTWEGSISGAVFAVAMAGFLSLFFGEFTPWQWMGMAAVVVVSGTLGDLSESLLKRSAGVKDSGTLLPGHGGFLDRFDSVLFSAPMVVLYIYFIKGNL